MEYRRHFPQEGNRGRRGDRGRWFGAVVVGGCLFFVTLLVAFSSFEFIQPYEVGIKQVKFGPNKGYSKEIKPGGKLYWLMPARDAMIHFPTNVQILNIPVVFKGGEIVAGTGVEVPTADGSKVTSTVTAIWRIYISAKAVDGGLVHGGPHELLNKAGSLPSNWVVFLRPIIEDRCRKALGALKTEDYYNSSLREQRAIIARKALNEGWLIEAEKTDEKTGEKTVKKEFLEGLNQYGVEVVDVLIRDYYYTSTIDAAIANKNIQVQEEKLRKAQEDKAFFAAEVVKAAAEGDAAIKNKEIEGASQKVVILSQAELYEKTKMSEGDLLVETAKATVKGNKAAALQEAGARLYVAQELVPLVRNLRGGIVTGINPFDLDAWIDMLTGTRQDDKATSN